jgi:hypothetical protein
VKNIYIYYTGPQAPKKAVCVNKFTQEIFFLRMRALSFPTVRDRKMARGPVTGARAHSTRAKSSSIRTSLSKSWKTFSKVSALVYILLFLSYYLV